MSDRSEAPRIERGDDPVSRMNNNRQFKLLADIPVRMSVEVGSTSLRLAEVMDLAEGSIVELDRQADDLLDIMVNGALIAKGEVVVSVKSKVGFYNRNPLRVQEELETLARNEAPSAGANAVQAAAAPADGSQRFAAFQCPPR